MEYLYSMENETEKSNFLKDCKFYCLGTTIGNIILMTYLPIKEETKHEDCFIAFITDNKYFILRPEDNSSSFTADLRHLFYNIYLSLDANRLNTKEIDVEKMTSIKEFALETIYTKHVLNK